MTKNQSYFYLSGLFISALGSMTYAATLPAIMYKIGIPAIFIGILIGTMRLNGFLVNSFFGHIGDKFHPREVLLFCELGAFIGSILIFFSWKTWGTDWLLPFAISNNIRAFFTALQAGSVQKLGKIFDGQFDSKGRYAIYINAVSNGALFIGGLGAMLLFDRVDIEKLIYFDALTFLLNGLIVFIGLSSTNSNSTNNSKKLISFNSSGYWRALPALAIFDIVLALSLSGANTLNLRLLEGSPELIPMMPTIFGGMALIVSSFGLDRRFYANNFLLWVGLAGSLLLQGVFAGDPVMVVFLTIFRNLFYWIIYNCISREVMQKAPQDRFSEIASGRAALNVSILALGEFWVGATKAIPVIVEMAWRSTVSLLAVAISKRVKNEK